MDWLTDYQFKIKILILREQAVNHGRIVQNFRIADYRVFEAVKQNQNHQAGCFYGQKSWIYHIFSIFDHKQLLANKYDPYFEWKTGC